MSEVNGAIKLPIRPANDEMPIAWLLYKQRKDKGKGNKKALLSQRRPRDAPNIWMP